MHHSFWPFQTPGLKSLSFGEIPQNSQKSSSVNQSKVCNPSVLTIGTIHFKWLPLVGVPGAFFLCCRPGCTAMMPCPRGQTQVLGLPGGSHQMDTADSSSSGQDGNHPQHSLKQGKECLYPVINDMLETGVIQPTISPSNNPIWMVLKLPTY